MSSELIVLKNTNNPIWSFGGNLIAPLYQGGALRAQVEIRSAEQKQAVAEYARAGQRAFGEVENALAAENALRDRDVILEATIRDSARALSSANPVSRRDRRPACGRAEPAALYSARIALPARATDGWRSGSTCSSRWGAASTCRRWNRWRCSDAVGAGGSSPVAAAR